MSEPRVTLGLLLLTLALPLKVLLYFAVRGAARSGRLFHYLVTSRKLRDDLDEMRQDFIKRAYKPGLAPRMNKHS